MQVNNVNLASKERGKSPLGEHKNKTIKFILCIVTRFGHNPAITSAIVVGSCSDSESSDSESEVARLREAAVDTSTLLQQR